MTDQDRYGQKLGKRFYAVRGILCSPEAGERGPLAVATYMLHHFKKQLPELKNLYGSAARAIANGGGIFGLRHELGEIERRGNGSLAATHFFDAMRRVAGDDRAPTNILKELAASGVRCVRDLTSLQRDYRDDKECQQRLAEDESKISDLYFGLLQKECGLEKQPIQRPVIRGQESLIDLVIAHQP